jgi:hypothetical protein
MRGDVGGLVGVAVAKALTVSTFHLLRPRPAGARRADQPEPGFTICDDADQLTAVAGAREMRIPRRTSIPAQRCRRSRLQEPLRRPRPGARRGGRRYDELIARTYWPTTSI